MKKHILWLKIAATLQLITAGFHSLSFIKKFEASNATEKQMIDLMDNYHMDMGLGFKPTMGNFMLSFSICFTLLLLFAGLLNWWMLAKKVDDHLLKGIVGINLLIFSACFLTMIMLTFIMPITCIGLIWLALLIAYLYAPKAKAN